MALNTEEIFTSYCDQLEDSCESFASELAFAALIDSSIMDSQELLTKNDIRTKYQKQSMIVNALSKQLEISKNKNLQITEKVEILEVRVAKLTESLELYVEQRNERENNMLSIIKDKDQEIQILMNNVLGMQSKFRVTENESIRLTGEVKRLEFEVERLKDLDKELMQANTKLKKFETIQEQLNKFLYKFSKNNDDSMQESLFQNQIMLKNQEIQMLRNISEEIKKSSDMQILTLKMEIDELKSIIEIYKEQKIPIDSKLLSESEKNNNDLAIGKFVDSYFIEAMSRLNLSSNYYKIKDFEYKIKGKFISIALCNEGIFAKIGLSLRNLDEYISDHRTGSCNPNIRAESVLFEKFQQKSDSELDKRRLIKPSSQKTLFKATLSSLCKTKPILDKSPSTKKIRMKSTERRLFK